MVTDALTAIIESQGLLLLETDCTVAMANLPAGCVDSIVTDPPYGLEFMGKGWDKLAPAVGRVDLRPSEKFRPHKSEFKSGVGTNIGAPKRNARCRVCGRLQFDHEKFRCQCEHPEWNTRQNEYAYLQQCWHESWVTEAFRLLKPGGHALIFGGTRTYHRLACAVEDAGFEIRDSIHWIYGQGFPKGKNNLKPAHEPILLARKPLGEKTVATNVLKHGTGGLNIDGGRIGLTGSENPNAVQKDFTRMGYHGAEEGTEAVPTYNTGGRWPANLILQHGDDCSDDQCVPGCPVAGLDGQSGNRPGGKFPAARTENAIYGGGKGTSLDQKGGPRSMKDTGGASRFFYQAKSSSSERNRGCESLYWARTSSGHTPITQPEYDLLDPKQRAQGNIHPTVKPLSLMCYLIRLVTPPGGIVLDPFLGSGTTALAARSEGFGCLAMESDPTSVLISRARWDGLHYGSS